MSVYEAAVKDMKFVFGFLNGLLMLLLLLKRDVRQRDERCEPQKHWGL